MNEQLNMDFSRPEPQREEVVEEANFELLDFQLAELMQQLNGESNQILKDCTLAISKHTREGKIAYKCTSEQQESLLKTKVVGRQGDYKPLIIESGYLYLRRYWQYQQQLADQIKSRINVADLISESKSSNRTDKNENDYWSAWKNKRLDIYYPKYSEEVDLQRVAAQYALEKKFLILSGGPGTGKTTTITRILALLIDLYNAHKNQNKDKKHTSPLLGHLLSNGRENNTSINILLAGPTGKAAIRMLDAITETRQNLNLHEKVIEQMPTQASTIHKLLGYIHGKASFKHNRENPLNADVVIVDEASMIDIALMSKLIDAVPAYAKLILIGDKDQLSSVETGSVFSDICKGLSANSSIESEACNIVTLQKNWRFSQDSGIGQLSNATNNGDTKKVIEILQNNTKPECILVAPTSIATKLIPIDFISPWEHYFRVLNDPQSTLSEIFTAFNHYRILCALRRGLNGSTIISSRIEATLDKQGLISLGRDKNNSWYHGRPVMITQNSYSKGLFNGDTGITLIHDGEAMVYFPDSESKQKNNFKSIAPIRLPSHETTWAMTIHKSQGSEFNQITLILPHEEMPLLTRQLIYTGVTRAKKALKIVASEEVLISGVSAEAAAATQINKVLVN